MNMKMITYKNNGVGINVGRALWVLFRFSHTYIFIFSLLTPMLTLFYIPVQIKWENQKKQLGVVLSC